MVYARISEFARIRIPRISDFGALCGVNEWGHEDNAPPSMELGFTWFWGWL